MLRPYCQRFLPLRLDLQVMLLVSIILGVTFPTFALYEANESAERAIESASLQAKALAENIAVTSVEHIITQDFASAEQLLLRSARFPGVIDIQLTDISGTIISDVMVDPSTIPILRYELTVIKPPSKVKPQKNLHNSFLTIWEPVISVNHVGWVKLTYSLEETEKIASEYLQDYMADGLIMMALLVAMILCVMKRPLNLLRKATKFAENLKDKSGAQMQTMHGSVEIEQLGKALNEASLNLYSQETAINEAMKALNSQKSAMDQHSIVSVIDTDGHITYANQKLIDLTGYSKNELLNRRHKLLEPGFQSVEFFQAMWDRISTGKVWHGEILNKSKHNNKVWLNTSIVPFMNEQSAPYEYVVIMTDISKRKQVEAELERKAISLKQMTDHLEVLVKNRTEELEQANIQLMHLNKIKSEFVSVVSHELRTPLTSIKSFSELLKNDIEDFDLKEQKHFLSIINKESDRLGRLINDLLDLQKIDSGKMVWKDKHIDLAKLLTDAAELFFQTFNDKGLTLQLSLPKQTCTPFVDEDRIKQVIANLLSNALKFTERGTVVVTLTAEPNHAKVSVCDSGVGIPDNELESVFESFHQVDNSETRKTRGSGLGLAICKEIIEHYQGRIWTESTLGKGSCFYFTLPTPKNNNEKSRGVS